MMVWLLPSFLLYATVAGVTGGILDDHNHHDHGANVWASWIWPFVLVYYMVLMVWGGGYFLSSLPRQHRQRVAAAAQAAQRAVEAAKKRSAELEQQMGRRSDGTYPDPYEDPVNKEVERKLRGLSHAHYVEGGYCVMCDKVHSFDNWKEHS